MSTSDWTFTTGKSAGRQNQVGAFRYYRPILRCAFCGRADGPGPRHVRMSDDGIMRLCQGCIAESVSIILEAYDEGATA